MSRRLSFKFRSEQLDIDVDGVLRKMTAQQRERFDRMEDVLFRRYKARGHKDADAKLRAQKDVDSLIGAAVLDFSDNYLHGKVKSIERLFQLQDDILTTYHTVLNSPGKKLDVDVGGLRAKYLEITRLFNELKVTPVQALPHTTKPRITTTANHIKITPTALPEGTTIAQASARLTGLKGRKGWSKLPDGGMRAKVREGTVDLHDVNGIIHVTFTPKGKEPVHFKEFDTLEAAYRSKPRSTRVIQAHHGCQDALMKSTFSKYGYDGGEAPTIWLRDSTGDSPHGVITHAMQNPNQAARQATPGISYGMIRDWAVADLKAAGAADDAIRAYLSKMDDYFKRDIEPKLIAKNAMHLKGEIKAY